jgi:hypothetical protein
VDSGTEFEANSGTNFEGDFELILGHFWNNLGADFAGGHRGCTLYRDTVG